MDFGTLEQLILSKKRLIDQFSVCVIDALARSLILPLGILKLRLPFSYQHYIILSTYIYIYICVYINTVYNYIYIYIHTYMFRCTVQICLHILVSTNIICSDSNLYNNINITLFSHLQSTSYQQVHQASTGIAASLGEWMTCAAADLDRDPASMSKWKSGPDRAVGQKRQKKSGKKR